MRKCSPDFCWPANADGTSSSSCGELARSGNYSFVQIHVIPPTDHPVRTATRWLTDSDPFDQSESVSNDPLGSDDVLVAGTPHVAGNGAAAVHLDHARANA